MTDVAQVVVALLAGAGAIVAVAAAIYRLGSKTTSIENAIKDGDTSLGVQISQLAVKIERLIEERSQLVQQNEKEHQKIWDSIRGLMEQAHQDHEKVMDLVSKHGERLSRLERDN